jgi:hypothetical protein
LLKTSVKVSLVANRDEIFLMLVVEPFGLDERLILGSLPRGAIMKLLQSIGVLFKSVGGIAKVLLLDVPVGAAFFGACFSGYLLTQSPPAKAEEPVLAQGQGSSPTLPDTDSRKPLVEQSGTESSATDDLRTPLPTIQNAPERTVFPFAYKYVGNVSTKKFHRPGCWYAQAMWSRRKRQFEFRKQAIDGGYLPCRCCLPQQWLTCRAAIKQATAVPDNDTDGSAGILAHQETWNKPPPPAPLQPMPGANSNASSRDFDHKEVSINQPQRASMSSQPNPAFQADLSTSKRAQKSAKAWAKKEKNDAKKKKSRSG